MNNEKILILYSSKYGTFFQSVVIKKLTVMELLTWNNTKH